MFLRAQAMSFSRPLQAHKSSLREDSALFRSKKGVLAVDAFTPWVRASRTSAMDGGRPAQLDTASTAS
jgi:hypothetical protein